MTDTQHRLGEAGTLGDDFRNVRLPELLLGGALVLEGVQTPGQGVPVSYVAVLLLGLVGLTRKPLIKQARWSWVFPLLIALLLYVAAISATSTASGGSDWLRRLIRLVLVLMLTYCLATRRLDLASLIKGLALGLIVNVALFYAGLAPDNYGGALSGYLNDKNKSGLYYAFGGVMMILVLRSLATRVFFTALFAWFLWLTQSRTSMTAFAIGAVWAWLIAPRLMFLRWAAAAGVNFLVNYLESNFAQAGVFENRWGSDLLRERIDAAAAEKLALIPWYGLGLGQAFVLITGDKWFFHNSYETLLVEGGWPYLIGVLLVTVMVGLRPFAKGDNRYAARVTQGATVVLLICALRLGEVFLTVPWALVMGAALSVQSARKPDAEAEPVADSESDNAHAS